MRIYTYISSSSITFSYEKLKKKRKKRRKFEKEEKKPTQIHRMGESDVSKGTSNSTKNVETKDPHKQAGDDTEIVLDIKNDGKIVFEESSEGLCLVSSFSTPTREKFGVKIGDTLVAVRIH